MSLYTAVCEVKLRVKNLMSDFSSSERTFYRYLLSLGAEKTMKAMEIMLEMSSLLMS